MRRALPGARLLRTPRQVVAGLSAALSNIQVKIGAAAAAATSTPDISQQDNDIFSDTCRRAR